MAKKSKMNWLLLGGVGAGLLWWWSTKQAATPVTSTSITPLPIAPPLQLPVPVARVIAPLTVVSPASSPVQSNPTPDAPMSAPATAVVSPASSPVQANPVSVTAPGAGPIGPGQATAAGVPYDPRMLTLEDWANTSLNSCDLARWNQDSTNFTVSEWAGLYDIYFNDWIGGAGNNAARTAFWNAWRTKYQILTGTTC